MYGRLSPVAYRPCITEQDFDMILPLPMDDHQLAHALPGGSRSLQQFSPYGYYVVVSQAATILHRYHCAMRTSPANVEEVVKDADGKLAAIIDSLPDHLSPDGEPTAELYAAEEGLPWIKWQRIDLPTLLLHLRIRVNRECQNIWLSSPQSCQGRRAVCLDSARMTILILSQTDLPLHQRRYWYVYASARYF